LESSQDILVVGEAESGAEAVTQAAALQPDVILMDIQMSDINGIEATRRILHTSPHIAILILTMFEDDDFVFSALRAGARGYLLKGTMKADLLRAIHAASSGEAIFGATIAKRLVTFFANIQQPRLPQVFPELSNREREILDLVAQGYKNPEIADKLVLSPKTVRNHVSNILSKLQVADRAQAILKAREAGLGNNDS
jgi:DNA-binding NarL/FixJ family response regulator